ncbi:hypothetical protein TSUD_328770 [Trifolium subterraneum]|uniref:DUF3741 domain-containing protein n=1 Tax=Trifolium subterraneum TaxID=3900 RepID=A0A2Z6M8K0_TRISU|nr:hypothetical protein TSUD_328770 [Trifolium subterraneum]
MKRQSSAVSPSSSRRETTPDKIHVKTIGCMSGILHLISTSNSRRHRRFLTFGKKQSKNNGSSVSTGSANSQPEKSEKESDKVSSAVRNPKLSCEVPRSPTLPAEIRRKSAENVRETPALVARLMGLETLPASPESVVEKRQKLIGALQRCDEDLKALKKIIESVRIPKPILSPSPAKVKMVCDVKCSAVNGEQQQQQQQQPSPVSVLEEFTRSPLSPNCYSGRYSVGKSSIFNTSPVSN